MKPRRIVTMTPNKLAVYFLADIFVADIVLADMVVRLWPILFFAVGGRYRLAVADMVCGRYGRTPLLVHFLYRRSYPEP